MRSLLCRVAIPMLLLAPPYARAAACPNLNAHPGVATIFLQTDFGDKDSRTPPFVFDERLDQTFDAHDRLRPGARFPRIDA